MVSPADIIRKRSNDIVAAVEHDEQLGSWRWISTIIETTIKEYRGRFLQELIQNGYDAHPAGLTNGQLAVHFHEDEDEHGVLYVANGGNPLSESNFSRMAAIADSDKKPGAGIGNKGIGFKSVFQICECPEIYSCTDTDDQGYSGFTFRFGKSSDLSTFPFSSEEASSRVRESLPLSLLTIPLETIPSSVLQFRADGYVTVLRLPARSRRSKEEIRERIDRLLASKSPIMLFLDRIGRLSVCASSSGETVLTREATNDGGCELVVLNNDERYRIFSKTIPQETLHTAIDESIDESSLDARWRDWESEAVVSVAVGDGWMVEDPAVFTFLPMSETARSPLAGHMNAPFATDFARLSLDTTHPLNRLMLEQVAQLCISSANTLIEAEGDPNMVIDLLSWHNVLQAPSLADSSTSADERLLTAIKLPDRTRTAWYELDEIWLWPEGNRAVLTAERAVSAGGAVLVHTEVDARRLSRLNELTAALKPDDAVLVNVVVAIARELASKQAAISVWNDFYGELPTLIQNGRTLAGKAIILTRDLSLALADHQTVASPDGRAPRTRSKQRAVFFSPRNAGADDSGVDDDDADAAGDLEPPRSLARHIAFLHPELSWHNRGQRTPGRNYLEHHGLARPFRTNTLLAHLGRVLSDRPTKTVRRDSLRFAYSLFAADPRKHSKELARVGLYVPTEAGEWLPAQSVHFTAKWKVEGGRELSSLVSGAVANDPNSELAALQTTLIADPATLGASGSDVSRWTEFLTVLGVTATLPIEEAADGRRIYGRSLVSSRIARGSDIASLPEGVALQWRNGISCEGNYDHPETEFSTRDSIYWFCGQHEIGGLSIRHRREYAWLVLLTLPSLRAQHQRSTWKRDRSGGVQTLVETPLRAFLTHAEWVPVMGPGDSTPRFVRPRDSWFIGPEDHMATSYSELVVSEVRRLMEQQRTMSPASYPWQQLGFKVWAGDHDAPYLIDHLSKVFLGDGIPEVSADHFRSSLAAAWAAVGNPSVERRPNLDDGLIIDRGGRLNSLTREESVGGPIYVASKSDQSATTRLVRELGWATVIVDTSDSERLHKVADTCIGDWWPGGAIVTTDWDVAVRVDGAEWEPTDQAPLLTETIPWLPVLLASIVRFPRGSGMGIGRHMTRILDRLSAIRLISAQSISIVHDGTDQQLPERLHGVLPMPGDIPTVLVQGQHEPPTWKQLEYLQQGVLELLKLERFTAEIRLTVRDLATDPDLPAERPTDAEIADTLGVAESQIAEIDSAIFGALSGVISRIRFVAACVFGEERATALDDLLSAVTTRDELVEALHGVSPNTAEAGSVLKIASSTATADQTRRMLGVPLAAYNSNLTRRFPEQPLVTNKLAQVDEFRLRVQTRRSELRERVRRSRYPQFASGIAQDDWRSIRNLEFLNCDPAWATSLDELGDNLIDRRIDYQIERVAGKEAIDAVLPSWEEVQEANGKPLRQRLIEFRNTVQAWCQREKRAAPTEWVTAGFDESLRDQLDRVGALDFTLLDDEQLVLWLVRVHAWPGGMEQSSDPAHHGLTSDEINAQQSTQARERAERLRASKQVTYQDQVFDVDTNMSGLAETVKSFLQRSPEIVSGSNSFSSLKSVPQPQQRRDGRSGRGASAFQASRRPSSDQSAAIGLVGEMLAFEWLRKHHRNSRVDETCWRSKNVAQVYEGVVGDDGLGYDFEILQKRGSLLYEVKATSSDAGMIELGETEVHCAQEHSGGDRWRLLIVEHVLSAEPRIHLLPNPFGRKSRGKFRFVGNSVRLNFTLQDR